MTLSVFAWRKTPIQNSELPALVYRDRIEAKEPGLGICENRLGLEIEIYADTTDEIRGHLADVEAAIFTDDTWGGLALYSELSTNEMEIEQKENIFQATNIILTVYYRTVFGDPLTGA